MSLPRYAGFTLRTECPRCGMPLPLDRPTRKATCGQCHADVSIPEQIWCDVVERFERDDRPAPGEVVTFSENLAGFNVHVQMANTRPCCEHCGKRFAIDELPGDAAQDFACAHCGDPASVWPAPDWLQSHVGTLRQLIATDPGGATAPEGEALDSAITEEPAPLAMPCPQCAGSLRITAKHERVINCGFCNTDVFLPDEVWRRLHPVKTVQWWFARFEGKTVEQMRRDREVDRDAAELAQKTIRAAEAFKLSKWAWLALAPFVAWQAVVIGVLVSGTIGRAALPYVVVSAALYTLSVAVSAWAIAVADGGKPIKHAFWYWLGGIVAFSAPVAGLVFGLIALALIWRRAKPTEKQPAQGVGRPLGFTYLVYCAAAQTLFIAELMHGAR